MGGPLPASSYGSTSSPRTGVGTPRTGVRTPRTDGGTPRTDVGTPRTDMRHHEREGKRWFAPVSSTGQALSGPYPSVRPEPVEGARTKRGRAPACPLIWFDKLTTNGRGDTTNGRGDTTNGRGDTTNGRGDTTNGRGAVLQSTPPLPIRIRNSRHGRRLKHSVQGAIISEGRRETGPPRPLTNDARRR